MHKPENTDLKNIWLDYSSHHQSQLVTLNTKDCKIKYMYFQNKPFLFSFKRNLLS